VCQQLNACAYLSDVEPRSEGFTVYPGSHSRLFQQHRYEANWSPLPSYSSVLREQIFVFQDMFPAAGPLKRRRSASC